MKKSLAPKKDPISNTNAGRGNTDKSDPRPLRDPNFMKDVKQKLIKFLESTDYPHRVDSSIFGKLTQTDVKAIFEHFVSLVVLDFRLDDSQIPAEDQILRFFTSIQYNNNFSKTHITSPAIFSSVPFVIGAFDFLRRFVSAFIRTDPKVLFPRVTRYGISSEVVLDSLISIYRTIENAEFNTNNLIELQDAIRNAIGIKSSSEIMKISHNVDEIEQMQTNVQRLERTIQELSEESNRIAICIETEDEKHSISKEILHKLEIEIRDETNCSNAIANEISLLVAKKREYEEKGYSDTINQIVDIQHKLSRTRAQSQKYKLESEELKQTIRSMELEIDDVKFQLQKIFADAYNAFPDLVNEEICQQITNFSPEYLLNYDGQLRPYISNLIAVIESKALIRREQLQELVKESEDLKRNSEALKSEIKLLESKNQIAINNFNQSEAIWLTLQEESDEHCKIIQNLTDQINHYLNDNDYINQQLSEIRKRFDEDKSTFEEASQFYESDIDFNQECADIQLQILQESHDFRESSMKRNAVIFEEKKENSKSFEANLEKRKKELMKKLTEELAIIDENFNF